MSQIINGHLYLIENSPFLHNIFPDGSVLVANKRCQNLKDLLVCGDPYNIKHDLTDIISHQCKPCVVRNVTLMIILWQVNHM